ncbi:hypothetical protein Rhopal_007442-T1 [Rhodotorula paludigena]|uniref:Transmembrane protein n=1 Tax=Rhodotorula paludigena TaxID=86838 RepID=A0AAV5GXW7_9BASI|nr:hypothetical protein Rhopal_007440-T1 [Rhodotorula paludigena]GJN94367.1 hypothetical protein Rhopal_007442-T1 [Rhodotorula paludigena]
MLGLGSAVRARRESASCASRAVLRALEALLSTFLRPLTPRAFSWDLDSPPPLVALLLRQRFAALCKVPFIISPSSIPFSWLVWLGSHLLDLYSFFVLFCVDSFLLPHVAFDDSAPFGSLHPPVLLLLDLFSFFVLSCFDSLVFPHILPDVFAHHPSLFHGLKLARLLVLTVAPVRLCLCTACSLGPTFAAILTSRTLPVFRLSFAAYLSDLSFFCLRNISRFSFLRMVKHKLQSASARTRLPATSVLAYTCQVPQGTAPAFVARLLYPAVFLVSG